MRFTVVKDFEDELKIDKVLAKMPNTKLHVIKDTVYTQ